MIIKGTNQTLSHNQGKLKNKSMNNIIEVLIKDFNLQTKRVIFGKLPETGLLEEVQPTRLTIILLNTMP